MSAYEVTEKVLEAIETDKYDLIILNFANADMVGHTGVIEAAKKAIESLDKCVPQIIDSILAKDGQILLTADHGNADVMLDKDGNTVTAHSLNDVPLLHIANEPKQLKNGGRLCDHSADHPEADASGYPGRNDRKTAGIACGTPQATCRP